MYTVLMAAALVIGSGDKRGGATDQRTVDATPPHMLLRRGMGMKDPILGAVGGLQLEVLQYRLLHEYGAEIVLA